MFKYGITVIDHYLLLNAGSNNNNGTKAMYLYTLFCRLYLIFKNKCVILTQDMTMKDSSDEEDDIRVFSCAEKSTQMIYL